VGNVESIKLVPNGGAHSGKNKNIEVVMVSTGKFQTYFDGFGGELQTEDCSAIEW